MKTGTLNLKLMLAFLVLSIVCQANVKPPKGGISGNIKERESGLAMEYANIALYSASDSSLISGTISAQDGSFNLADVNYGEYYLELYFLGFEKKTIADIKISKTEKDKNLGTIFLSSASQKLSSVDVVAEKSSISYQLDKKVINVGKDLSSAGGTAVQVIENAPSVQVDAEGNVQMRGSSDFTVLINGKPSLLKGSEALKQLPASGIEKVELITNPSAKYDPDGKSGIINIIMKENSLDGLNGLVNVSAGYKDKYSANGTVNYRIGKINLFSGIEYSERKFFTDLDFERTLFNENTIYSTMESDGELTNSMDALIISGGFDYYLNNKTDLTLSVKGGNRGYDNSNTTSFTEQNFINNTTKYGVSNKYMDVQGQISEVFTSLTHKFNEGHDIVISGQFQSWNGFDAEDMEELITNSTHTITDSIGMKNRYHKDDFNYQLRFKADYQRTFDDNSRIELGYQLRDYRRFEEFRREEFTDGVFVPTNDLNNDLDYIRDIHSVYSSYSSTIAGFNYQLGIRLESTNRNINISNEEDEYTYEKLDLFPTLHVSRVLPADQQIQFSYSRRVRRPNSWILNNNPKWFDQNNIFYGDPLLEPEFADSYEAGYRKSFKKFSINSQTYYRNTKNAFATIRYLADTVNNIVHHKQTNANNMQATGIELGSNLNFTKWLQVNMGANLYYYDIEGEMGGASINNSNFTWDARMNANIIFKWGSRLQLNAYYSAPSVDLGGERDPFLTTSVALSHEFGPLTVSANLRDAFGTLHFNYNTKSTMENTNYNVNPESYVVMVNLSYKFNNFQHKKRNVDGDNEYTGGGF